MNIRVARLEDALAIHNLHTRAVRQLCSADYPKAVIDSWLEGRSPEGYLGIAKNEMYVFVEGGVVMGWSHVRLGSLVALFVDPSHVRKGIGRALFEHAFPIARGNSPKPIAVEATLTALPFYLSCGCREIHRSSVRKNGVEVATVRMLLPEGRSELIQASN